MTDACSTLPKQENDAHIYTVYQSINSDIRETNLKLNLNHLHFVVIFVSYAGMLVLINISSRIGF